MKKFGILSVFVTSVFLIGCTGLVGKGDKLFESGLYHEAATYYQRALKKNPDNVDAQLGLSRARYKIIDTDLIEVRMLRLSSNRVGAAQKLEQVLRNQLAWNIKLDGALTVTQSEETRFAKNWLLDEAHKLAQSPHPDQFRWFEHAYSQLIATTQIINTTTELNSQVNAKGKARCIKKSQLVKGQQFFLGDFLARYCAAWGQKTTLRLDAVDQSRYQGLSIRNSVKHYMSGGFITGSGVSQRDNLNMHLNELESKFSGNIWYSPAGAKQLTLTASGQVNYFRVSERVRRKVNYSVDRVIKSKDAQGNEVSKKVESVKVHYYDARVYEEQFSFSVDYKVSLKGQSLKRNSSRDAQHTTESHNEDFQAAGLYPQGPDFMNVDHIFSHAIAELNDNFVKGLNENWQQRYCEQRANASSAGSIGENALRCAKFQPDNVYVNNWFNQHFGLDYQRISTLYGS